MIEQQLQSQRMEALGRLTGGVAHDFNNLLTIIRGFSEMLLLNGVAEAGRAKVEEIIAAAERGAALTRQLLAFGRPQSSQPAVINANRILGSLQNLLQRLIGEDIVCNLGLAPDLMTVKIDPNQLEQVLLNLAANARDAMPYGGSLSIVTRNAHLDSIDCLSYPDARPGDYVRIAVSDTGIGMDDDTLARVFEPFFTTKPHDRGTGLGLTTAYGIVKHSGGFLSAASEPGKGSIFTIYLPAVPATPEQAAVRPERRRATGSETILLVEDEPGLREMIRDFLISCGYNVLAAAHPEEARRISEFYLGPIHVLLTDMIMPQATGFDLAAQIRKSRSRIRVLFISGYNDHSSAVAETLGAAAAFLAKPFSLYTLGVTLRELLNQPFDSSSGIPGEQIRQEQRKPVMSIPTTRIESAVAF